MRIEREHTAAIVIDYQEKLMPAMDRKEALTENSSILLAGLRTLGIPMVLTQQYTKGLGSTVKELTRAAGTEEFVEKIRFSAFEDVIRSCPQIQEEKIYHPVRCGSPHLCAADIDRSEGGRLCACSCDRLCLQPQKSRLRNSFHKSTAGGSHPHDIRGPAL